MQISAFVGLSIGVLVVGYVAGDVLPDLYDLTMIFLVVAGGIAATLVSDGLRPMLGAIGAARYVFAAGGDQPRKLIGRVVTYAKTARNEGVLSLEHHASSEPNPFLQSGIQLTIDGTERPLIMDILETELSFSIERNVNDERVLERLGLHWASFGGIGCLLALVQGGGMVAAGLPLLYGVLLYVLFGGAFARKLARHYAEQRLLFQMSIEGVMAIQAGDSPQIIRHKLAVFVAPKDRPTVNEIEMTEPLPRDTPVTPDITSEEVEGYVERGRERIIGAVREAIDQSDRDLEECKEVMAFLNRVEQGEFSTMSLLVTLGPELHQVAMEALQHSAEPQTTLIDGEMLEHVLVKRELDFESLNELEDRQIQMLLPEIDYRDALTALKGASTAVRDKILSNMSERVRGAITEELSFVHFSPHDVLGAQTRIVRELHRILGSVPKE
tara:strand:- start:730 stop:2052 length:1323 start_codon:yes stop_codon:yes gene_type:complete